MFKKTVQKVAFKNRLKLTVGLVVLLLATQAVQISHAGNSDLAGQYYERAVLEHRKGNNKAAILELKNAIQQNSDYLAAQILLAEVYLQDKDLIATEAALSQADRLNADPALLVMTRAQLYLYELKYGLLLRDIKPEQFNSNLQPDLHIYRGHAHLQLNQPIDALNEYKTAARKTPNRIEPVIGRANALLRSGDIQGATKAAEKAAKMQPDSANSWYIKAAINHALGRLQQAITEYAKAVKLDPEHYDARIAHAGVLMDLQRDDEAEKDLLYLRETYSFDAKVAYLHAVVLARNNRQNEADLALTAASAALDSIDPKFLNKHAQTLMLSGLVNFSLKRFDLAMHAMQTYIQLYPQQSGAYKLLASILLDKGEYERVIKLLQPVLAFAGNDHRLLFLLGSAYMQNGQHDQANAVLEKASELEVQGAEITTELGLNRLAMGQETLAIKNLESALKNNPGNSKAGIPLAIMYITQRQPEKAMRVAKIMLERAPDNLTLLNLLGTTQVGVGDRKMARNSFNKAIAINPGFITGHINLSKLDVLEKKPDSAKQRLNSLLKRNPQNIALQLELARVYEAEGDYSNASDRLEKLRKIDSKSLPALLALIELNLKISHYPEALNLALEAQSQNHKNMQVQEILARTFMANGNQGKATSVLREMSRSAGFNAKRLYQIAQQQYSVADYPGAIKSLKNALSGNKYHIPARVALAETQLQLDNAIFASNHAKFLVDHYPDRSFGYRLLGEIEQKEGNQKKAVKYYQIAFNKGQNTFLLMKLYSALKQTGNNSRAFKLVVQWVAEHQQDAVPIQALAEEYLHSGRLKKAQKYYEQLVLRFKKRPDLLNNLAYIYFNTGDNKALDYAKQAQQLAPDQPAANDTLGWILVNKDQPEQGLHYLRNAHARSSQDPEIRYHIAVALTLLQRDEEAKVELKQALKANTSFNGSDDAERLLKKLGG